MPVRPPDKRLFNRLITQAKTFLGSFVLFFIIGCASSARPATVSNDLINSLREPAEPRTQALIASLFKDSERYASSLSATLPSIKEDLVASRIGVPIDPLSIGGFRYQLTYPRGQSHPVLIRSRAEGNLQGIPEAVLDFNILFSKTPSASLSRLRINRAQSLIAFIAHIGPSRTPVLFVQRAGDLAPNIAAIRSPLDIEWLTNTDLAYLQEHDPETARLGIVEYLGAQLTVLDHQIDLPGKQFEYALRKAAGTDSLLLRRENFSEASDFLLSRKDNGPSLQPPFEYADRVKYRIFPKGSAFFVLTNENCPNFCLLFAPDSENRFPLYSPPAKASILSVEAFDTFLVVYEQRAGKRGFVVLTPQGDLITEEFPDDLFTAYTPSFTDEFDTGAFHYYKQGFFTLKKRYRYDVARQLSSAASKKQPLPPPTPLRGELIYAPARDGEKIPVSFICHANTPKGKPQPTLLVAYGAYGKTLEPEYPSLFVPLLKREFCVAFAHIRGGGFYGPMWHAAATGIRKMQSVHDVIDVAEHLVAEGYTDSANLSAFARSAGAVSVASAVLKQPKLFTAVAFEAPFLDVKSIGEATDGLSLRERDEWGDLSDPAVLAAMSQYNPMDLIQSQAYPALFVTAGTTDKVVPYWHGLVWGYRMLVSSTSDRPVNIRIHKSADHKGRSTAFDQLEEESMLLSFFLKESESADEP